MMKIRTLLLGLLCCLSGYDASAFTFLGPYKSWQTTTLGYRDGGDIGGPMLPSEGYRWNVPVIYYAFDRSFVEYFGQQGMAAVDAAVAHINALPPASLMSADLAEYPLNTRQINYEAQALGLLDLKSWVMSAVLEELGLGNPEQYVWTLAGRETVGSPTITNYSVVRYNFDPVTLTPSSYVNGALYSYHIVEYLNPGLVAIAPEIKIGDLRTAGYTSVAGGGNGGGADAGFQTEQDLLNNTFATGRSGVYEGQYYFGLTRDDVGGLKRLYGRNSLAVEDFLGTVNGTGGGVWTPVSGTNSITSTNTVPPSLRPGIDKISFQKVAFDSVLSQTFVAFTNHYTDYYITNSTLRTRSVARAVLRPDIVFTCEDIPPVNGVVPVVIQRTDTANWVNNVALNIFNNGNASGGPGVITPSVRITFNALLPFALNSNPGEDTEGTQLGRRVLGSFDGSTNAPVIYPIYSGVSLDLLRQLTVKNPR